MLEKIIKYIQHKDNPLHVYCRLRDLGLSKERARKLGEFYELKIYKPFLKKIK
ncbi:MAG: hypothetical protein ABIB43_01685 [archaeon]